MKTTKKQIEQIFKTEILPSIPANDRSMRQMYWNDFCDSLHKDGQISDHQANNWSHPKFIDK